PSGATLIVALGHAPNRRRIDLSKPTTPPVNQYCKNGGDHRFLWAKRFLQKKCAKRFDVTCSGHVYAQLSKRS
ncbi:hypothetical protein, partial [Pseudomonas fluorescens]|uniref:hypothetical protein n=1 Tax=Pseudomonas fluorescens TaxID=294 RepID=UPI001CD6C3BD